VVHERCHQPVSKLGMQGVTRGEADIQEDPGRYWPMRKQP
jgi:hypothetical protein